MKILIIENAPEGVRDDIEKLTEDSFRFARDADLIIGIPEGGEPMCVYSRFVDLSDVMVKTVTEPTAADLNAENARKQRALRERVEEAHVSEAPLVKASRVWDHAVPEQEGGDDACDARR